MDVVALLPLRLVGFAAFQGVIALVLLVVGIRDPWAVSVAWWPIVAVMTNLLTYGVVARLLRLEGTRFRKLFAIDAVHIPRDAFVALGVAAIAAALTVACNFWLATVLFGDAEAPLSTLIQPLPMWGAVSALVLLPTTIAGTELATYFAYLEPRLETRLRRRWLAVALVVGFLSLQHATLPLVPDWRFLIWRACMFLPLALVLGVALRSRPRLLPYLAVLHGLTEVQAMALIVAVSS